MNIDSHVWQISTLLKSYKNIFFVCISLIHMVNIKTLIFEYMISEMHLKAKFLLSVSLK